MVIGFTVNKPEIIEMNPAKNALKSAVQRGLNFKQIIAQSTTNQFASTFANFDHSIKHEQVNLAKKLKSAMTHQYEILEKRKSALFKRNVPSLRQEILDHWLKGKNPFLEKAARLTLNSEVFVIDNVFKFTAQAFSEANGTKLGLDNQYIRLPYPVCLFEYNYCDAGLDMGKVGALAASGQDDEVVFVVMTTRPRLDCPFTFKFKVNPDGMCTEEMMEVRAEGFFRLQSKPEQEKVLEFCCGIMTPVLYAINLLGCKNIRPFVKTESSHTGKTRLERKHEPEHIFKVLNVPLINKVANGEIKLGEHGNMPLHTVRGHFKTFTPEKPLLGKHVGRYWWDPMIRGKAENGLVEKEYHVDASVLS